MPISGKIVSLKDGQDLNIFPETAASAVYLENGKTLEDSIITYKESDKSIIMNNPDMIQKINNMAEEIKDIILKKVDSIPLFLYSPFKDEQGDCFIISYNNKTIMIDCGVSASSTKITQFMRNKNINKVDYMFITHYHTDHCQGLANLITSLDFSNCLFILPPSVDWNSFLGDITSLKNNEAEVLRIIQENNFNFKYLTANEEMNIDRLKLKFLNCDPSNYTTYYSTTGDSNGPTTNDKTNYNNFAVSLLIIHENNTLFLPSDIDITAQGMIYDKIDNVDFMCYPHHGVNELSNDKFIDKLTPKICLASGNGYKRYSSSDLIKMFPISTSYNNKKDFELISVGNTIRVLKGQKIVPYTLQGDKGDSISSNSDLNDYIYVGDYYSGTGSNSQTLLNTPVTDSGFRLKVRDVIKDGSIVQELIVNSSDVRIFTRYIHLVNKTFGDWIEITKKPLTNVDDTISLVDFIKSIKNGTLCTANITTSKSIYNEISSLITDSHGLFLKVDKLSDNYAILTLTGKNNERYIVGHYVSGSIKWMPLTSHRFSPNNTDSLTTIISNIDDYNFKLLNISSSMTVYNELSSMITDSHGLFLKIEKLNGNYAILTLTGKSVEKMFIGHYNTGKITWKEVQLI